MIGHAMIEVHQCCLSFSDAVPAGSWDVQHLARLSAAYNLLPPTSEANQLQPGGNAQEAATHLQVLLGIVTC